MTWSRRAAIAAMSIESRRDAVPGEGPAHVKHPEEIGLELLALLLARCLPWLDVHP